MPDFAMVCFSRLLYLADAKPLKDMLSNGKVLSPVDHTILFGFVIDNQLSAFVYTFGGIIIILLKKIFSLCDKKGKENKNILNFQ